MEENNPIRFNGKNNNETIEENEFKISKDDPQTEEMKKIREELGKMNPKLATKEEMEDINRRVGEILKGKEEEYKNKNNSLLLMVFIISLILCIAVLIAVRVVRIMSVVNS